jgi:hypothetical protein
LGKPIPSPVVLGQVTEKFREAVKAEVERQQIPVYQFQHGERKDDVANDSAGSRGAGSNRFHWGCAGEGEGVQWHEGQWSDQAVPQRP